MTDCHALPLIHALSLSLSLSLSLFLSLVLQRARHILSEAQRVHLFAAACLHQHAAGKGVREEAEEEEAEEAVTQRLENLGALMDARSVSLRRCSV